MAKNIMTKPRNEIVGPTAVRTVLKMSGLNFSYVVGSPLMRKKPRIINAAEMPIST